MYNMRVHENNCSSYEKIINMSKTLVSEDVLDNLFFSIKVHFQYLDLDLYSEYCSTLIRVRIRNLG